MSVSRRQFCRVTAGLCASQAVLGTASAQTSIEVSGTVRSDGDSEVAGAELRFSNTSAEQRAETTIQSNGEFTVVVPEPGTYRVTLFDESPERDGVPAVYSFNNVSISETGDIGELSLPRAYEVSIRFVDADGSPVEGLPVNFRAENGTGLSPGIFTTDADGYTKYSGASNRGVELTGQTQVELLPRGAPPTVVQQVFVTDSEEFEFTVQNPEQYGGESAGGSSGVEDDGGAPERGLFSNSGDEPEFVSNPLNLTTAGFLLSVAGIGYQMIEGR